MLVSTVVTVVPRRDVTVPANLGRASYATFLGLVRDSDSALSERLHEANQMKPFTVSSLQGVGVVNGEQMALRKDEEYWLRFTSLDPILSEVLLSGILPNLPSTISLGRADYDVIHTTMSQDAHQWAGTTTYEELVRRSLVEGESATSKIMLRFLSPTTFRSQDKNVPLPTPDLVFGSLVDKWNAMSGVYLPPQTREFASRFIAISRFNLRSRVLFSGRYQHVGCVGNCTYEILAKDPYWIRVVNLLADFALYAGVGSKTTVGMGQVRRR